MHGKNCESAVSETIGVTLAVALTVILAAIVAAYLFGMIPSMPVTRTLAYAVDQPSSDQIIITFHGGPDASSLEFSRVEVTESGGGTPTYRNSTEITPDHILGKKVGSVMTVTAGGSGGFTGQEHIIITAHFDNNQEQVVLETFV